MLSECVEAGVGGVDSLGHERAGCPLAGWQVVSNEDIVDQPSHSSRPEQRGRGEGLDGRAGSTCWDAG